MESTQLLWSNGPALTQRDGVFPLCTDAVLLADFTFGGKISRRRIAELGCGCGAVSLLLALDYPRSEITAIDISPPAAELAEHNINQNGLNGRVSVINADLRAFTPKEKFDTVVCNPPYFPENAGKVSETLGFARAESECTLEDVCRAAARIAGTGASLCLVYRPERLAALLEAVKNAGFEPKRLRFVHHSASHAPSTVLLEAVSGGKPGGLKVLPPLLICGENGKNTPEYNRIYRLEEQ